MGLFIQSPLLEQRPRFTSREYDPHAVLFYELSGMDAESLTAGAPVSCASVFVSFIGQGWLVGRSLHTCQEQVNVTV